MKFASVILAAIAFGWCAHAQIELRLSVAQEFFLPGEELDVAVKVANFTGGPLTLGEQPDWIRFTVERADSGVVNKLSEVEESGTFLLQHATVGTLHFNLMPHFALDQAGTYRVVAQATTPNSPEVFTSAPITFEIVRGVRLNPDRELGVTLPDGTTVRRKYILQQVNFLRKVQLYLRVTDATESLNLKVARLGPIVSFDPPKWVIDRSSQFHVLQRIDANTSAYHVFQPDGSLQRREFYRFTQSTPELRVNDEGEIAVIGGIRRLTTSDLPAPRTNRPPEVQVPVAPKPAENAKKNDERPPVPQP
jgi:hypothetical protein